MANLVRGRIYRIKFKDYDQKYYFVVSNNSRNRKLDQVLAVRVTTSPKPELPSIVKSRPEKCYLDGSCAMTSK